MENKDGKALKTLRNTCDLPQSEVLVSETGKEVNNGAAAAAESSKAKLRPDMPIWWSNAIFFCSMHLMGLIGVLFLRPWSTLDYRTAWLCFASWQLATYGITMGYHRLWSHQAFTARMPLRIALAACGCLGFQGSIKWWVLRHRLHHRWTDTDSDPYDAQKGLLWSHLGWIFFKPRYEKLSLIDKKDLDADPVVRLQHRFYLSSTLFLGLVLPTLIGATWGDAIGGYIWGGIVARLLIWHCTFCINSLAHYLGDQPYSEDVTARGNYLLAMLTGGEASHNFHHAFPQDYRNGPNHLDWDPTKLFIWFFHNFTNQIPHIRQTEEADILKARAQVLHALAKRSSTKLSEPLDGIPSWQRASLHRDVECLTELRMAAGSLSRPLVIVIDDYALDVSAYSKHHPGGLALLRRFAIHGEGWHDATEAFHGGFNNHGTAAKQKMESLRIARIV